MNIWQIRDTAGRVIVDRVSHQIALEMLAILQHHVIKVTMHHVGESA